MSEPDRPRAPSLPGGSLVGDRFVLRIVGPQSPQSARGLISRGIEEAKRLGAKKLLVLAAEVEIPALPTTLDRYNAIVEWAHAGGASVRFALVVREEVMDPGRFDVELAASLGTNLKVFASETDAVAWLDAA